MVIGRGIIDFAAFDPKASNVSVTFIIATLIGAVLWNLITRVNGFASSSFHALVGRMEGAVPVMYRADRILWKGLLYAVISLIISLLLVLIFGYLILKLAFHFSKNATPQINYFFNRTQIPSSIALALGHGANDIQRPIGLLAIALVIIEGFYTSHIPLWVIFSCGIATALGAASGG